MPEIKFRVPTRFKLFFSNLHYFKTLTKKSQAYFGGWLISLILLALLIAVQENKFYNFILILHGFFLFKLISRLHVRLKPPVELLLLAYFAILLLDVGLSKNFISLNESRFAVDALSAFFHIFLLGLLTLVFSLMLVENHKGKRGILLWFTFLALLSQPMMTSESFIYHLLFQGLVLISLLRQTRWLEELTKTECWIYLLATFYIYSLLSGWNPIHLQQASLSSSPQLWLSLPYFFFISFKLYFIALMIKIPVVLVYNHARLSRKLWISGLFQSTFPQLIQFFILVLMFYFFIAGWQAEKFRSLLVDTLKELSATKANDLIPIYTFKNLAQNATAQLPGFEAMQLVPPVPAEGIITLDAELPDTSTHEIKTGYFLFLSQSDSSGDFISMVRLDTLFLKDVAARTPLFLGNRLLAYPHFPSSWENWLYKLDILTDENKIRIFPFGLLVQKTGKAITVPIEQKGNWQKESQINVDLGALPKNPVTLGRVLAPLYNFELRESGYFAFDITLMPNLSFFASPIFRYAIYLIGIYFLINVFVIRRVVKFGSEINDMIVQKFNLLKKGIGQIASGNLDYKVKLEGEDEFVELGEHFNQLGSQLKQSIAEVREKERLEQELKIARQVQLSFLPKKLPEVRGYQVAASLKTATEVGGDFYDILSVKPEKFLYTIGDVSGKSTSAAFYMAQCISLIRYTPQFTYDPIEIAHRLNRYFAEPLVDRQMFVTAIIGLIDTDRNEVKLIRAGHTLPLLIPGNETKSIYELESSGIGIGLSRYGMEFEKSIQPISLTLAPGDTLVMYTDGVIEASRKQLAKDPAEKVELEFYGENRLRAVLERTRGQSAWEILHALSQDILSFYNHQPPTDDYTLLIIQKSA